MKIKYFISQEHHKEHLSFVKSVLGGEDVCEYARPHAVEYTENVAKHDGEDVIWIFSHVCYNIHSRIKGKQIYVSHGVSFKKWLDERAAKILNDHFSIIFGGAYMHEYTMVDAGVDKSKICPIAYPILFDIPSIPVQPNSVLFSSTVYSHWNHYQNLYHILKNLHPSLKGYLTMHPNTRDNMRELLLSACRGKNNIKVLETQKELMEAYAYCQCVVGGSSSVLAPFWYFKKPVIFLKGGEGYNLFKRFGWSEIKKQITNPDFHQILKESTKVSHWLQFSPDLVKKAKVAPTGSKLFYPLSDDKQLAINQIRDCISLVSGASKAGPA